MHRAITRTLGLAAATAASAAGVLSIVPSPALASSEPPCSASAITAGLHRGRDAVDHGTLVKPWKCSGRFAFAEVLEGEVQTTQLLVAAGGRWEVADRANYCQSGQIPRSLYRGACESN